MWLVVLGIIGTGCLSLAGGLGAALLPMREVDERVVADFFEGAVLRYDTDRLEHDGDEDDRGCDPGGPDGGAG